MFTDEDKNDLLNLSYHTLHRYLVYGEQDIQETENEKYSGLHGVLVDMPKKLSSKEKNIIKELQSLRQEERTPDDVFAYVKRN